ncbi:beta-ketoacyl-ACP synthase III [Desulfovibrio ferrophilus]|uniref:Beta-ketoacyl-[acyl-carrier-protein] synthase III n=1 Tax=Desulfovibrio ferrophilus TaxID=241368 RepID=A0A2Z6B0E4_9BACT|nr:beta-ketoacyl-ACP synthase III [Desulfovibrio ferrophilus]BBD08943.1 3-oxoacyl-[acyl-carrier-protein] synthase 3 [Desulfovibrio ferrophilus]
MTQQAYIRGFGFNVPDNIVTNADLEKIVDTSDEWITTRTGINQRHISQGEVTSDLGTKAAQQALTDAGMSADEVTHIICATCSPDSYCPNTATQIQHKLGISGCMAFDLNAACSGFIYSLQVARSFVNTDPSAVVLIVASEVLSPRTNWEDRTTCVLFGDGSGAAVVTADKGENGVEIQGALMESDGQYGELLTILGGGSEHPYKLGDTIDEAFFIQMNGREVYKVAVRSMTSACKRLIEQSELTVDDIDVLIPHQANLRIIEAVGKKLGIPEERVFTNVQKYGNTSAASVGIALAEGRAMGVLEPGTRALLTTFGAGFTWGALILQF